MVARGAAEQRQLRRWRRWRRSVPLPAMVPPRVARIRAPWHSEARGESGAREEEAKERRKTARISAKKYHKSHGARTPPPLPPSSITHSNNHLTPHTIQSNNVKGFPLFFSTSTSMKDPTPRLLSFVLCCVMMLCSNSSNGRATREVRSAERECLGRRSAQREPIDRRSSSPRSLGAEGQVVTRRVGPALSLQK